MGAGGTKYSVEFPVYFQDSFDFQFLEIAFFVGGHNFSLGDFRITFNSIIMVFHLD